jgi:cytochrome P450
VWQRLVAGRRNLLAMWEEQAFTNAFGRTRVLMREVFTCNSAEAVRFAFSLKNSSFERKAPQMRHSLAPLLGDGLFVSDGETWRKRRRMVAPIVHVSQLSRFAPVMVEAADEVRARWEKSDGAMIDALSESAWLTAEVICRALFGRKLGRDYAAQIVDGFSEYQRLIGQIDLMSLLGLPDWVPRWHRPALRRAIRRIHAVLDHVIDSYRNKKDSDEDSVIQRLLDARDPDTGAPLEIEAIRNEIAVLFMAGHETTANSMAWSWLLLSQAPEAEAKLHRELAEVLGGRLPTLADVPKLVYTRAVFEEAMRLYPPVPILPREALRDEYFGTAKIPRGAIVLVVPWLLHRNPNYWEKPDHFMPERFLPENAGGISKFVYIPFSIGPRICAGMSFGLTEAILCLATLAQHFQLRLKLGHEVRPVCRLTLRPEGGLPMTVHVREARGGEVATPAPTSVAAAACPFHNA